MRIGFIAVVLVVFMFFRLRSVHPVLFMFLERCLEFLVLAPLVDRRPALLFGLRQGEISLRAGHAGRRRQQPFEILPFARWTGWRVRSADERLELMAAAAALVFVQRHRDKFIRSAFTRRPLRCTFRRLPY